MESSYMQLESADAFNTRFHNSHSLLPNWNNSTNFHSRATNPYFTTQYPTSSQFNTHLGLGPVLCPRPIYVAFSVYISVLVSLLSFCPSAFPSLFAHPSVSLPSYSNTSNPLWRNLCFNPAALSPQPFWWPLTPQIPASSPPSRLPLRPPWSGA